MKIGGNGHRNLKINQKGNQQLLHLIKKLNALHPFIGTPLIGSPTFLNPLVDKFTLCMIQYICSRKGLGGI